MNWLFDDGADQHKLDNLVRPWYCACTLLHTHWNRAFYLPTRFAFKKEDRKWKASLNDRNNALKHTLRFVFCWQNKLLSLTGTVFDRSVRTNIQQKVVSEWREPRIVFEEEERAIERKTLIVLVDKNIFLKLFLRSRKYIFENLTDCSVLLPVSNDVIFIELAWD